MFITIMEQKEVSQLLPGIPAAEASVPDALRTIAQRYLDFLLSGQRRMASQVILGAVSEGVPVIDIYMLVLQPVLYEVGQLWQTDKIGVAQEHFCTAVTQSVMSQLYPHILSSNKGPGRMVATCVEGELHEIGLRMVADIFELNGWQTYYLGASTPAESIVKTIIDRKPQVLAISATLTQHVPLVESQIRLIRKECSSIYVMVGGYPFNTSPDLWRTLGADAYAPDARQAVEIANQQLDSLMKDLSRFDAELDDVTALGDHASVSLPIATELVRHDQFPHDKNVWYFDELTRLNNDQAVLQRELARKNAQLERLNREKNQFLGMAAHDLRSPLGLIRSFADLLDDELRPVMSHEQRSYLNKIKESSNFLLGMISDLLDISVIESGRLELELAPIDYASIIENIVHLNQVLARRKNIEISMVIPGALPRVVADKNRVEQALNNLIGNAIKFSYPETRVEVSLKYENESVIVSVKDQGQGIPESELNRLFKPFHRTSVRSTDGEKNTGLGLAIVQKIIASHGGKVWVNSVVGQGSTFSFSIPAHCETLEKVP